MVTSAPKPNGKGHRAMFHVPPQNVLTEIREIPDHVTFRGKGVNTGLVRQTWGISLFGPM